MKTGTQRYLILFLALALTAFLAGGFLVGWKLTQDHRQKLCDNAFLEKQLARIKKEQEGEKKTEVRRKKIRTEEAKREKLGATRFFSGRLIEIQRSILAAETTGPLVSLPVEVGMKITKGKTLIGEVDTIWSKLAAEQARRQIEVSTVQKKFNQREYDRLKSLSDQGPGYVSASDLDSQLLKIEENQANIALQQVVLTEAEKKLARSQILAPYDGVIVRKISDVGSFVSPGSPLVEIVSTGQIDAELTVSEAFIDRLHIGDKVPIWIDALNQEMEGTIFSIVPYGSTAARAFPVRIRLNDADGQLKVGMSVRGRLQITDAKDSIVLPKDAVLDRPDSALVWVVVNKSDEKGNPVPDAGKVVQPVQVVISARTDIKYAVVPISDAGRKLLQPGAECVIEGADRLIVDEPVVVIKADPALLKNLPTASGHSIIEPIDETPFFDTGKKSSDEVRNDPASSKAASDNNTSESTEE